MFLKDESTVTPEVAPQQKFSPEDVEGVPNLLFRKCRSNLSIYYGIFEYATLFFIYNENVK